MRMAGMAIILFCAAGIAAIVGWIPASIGGIGNSPGLAAAAARPAGAKTHMAPVQVQVLVASNAPARAKCTECGVVESTREIDTRGEGSGLGAVGGAVLGGVLGN
jgi:hypothetical protein